MLRGIPHHNRLHYNDDQMTQRLWPSCCPPSGCVGSGRVQHSQTTAKRVSVSNLQQTERGKGQQQPRKSSASTNRSASAEAVVCKYLLLCVQWVLFVLHAAVRAQRPTSTNNASADNANSSRTSSTTTADLRCCSRLLLYVRTFFYFVLLYVVGGFAALLLVGCGACFFANPERNRQ